MASSAAVRAKVASLGMGLVQPASGLAALERLLLSSAVSSVAGRQVMQGLPVVDVVPFRWGRLLQRYNKLPHLFSVMAKEWSTEARDAPAQPHGGVTAVRVSGAAAAAIASADNAGVRKQLLVKVKEAISGVIGREVSWHSCDSITQLRNYAHDLVAFFCWTLAC